MGNIIAVSQRKNVLLQVTGCLIFTEVHFAQYVEGPWAGVTELKKNVGANDRHTNVTTIYEEQIERRRFPDWSLAYAGLSVLVAQTIEETMKRVHAGDKTDIENSVRLMEQFSSSTLNYRK